MSHSIRQFVAIGFCCVLLSTPVLGQNAEAPKVENYPLPPLMLLPTVRVAAVEADGKIRLESIPERPQFWQTTEGYYLLMAAPVQPGMTPGSRTKMLDGLLRVEVVEVAEGNKLTAKSSREAASMLKVGDMVSLVRPAGMSTAQIKDLPAAIPTPKDKAAKAGGGANEAVTRAQQAARTAQSVNNLKQMGLAMHNFHSVNNCFPPAVVFGPDGKPWHSWRVLILPYLEQGDLFNQYDFTQPWNSPKNSALIEKMPSVYRDPLNGETTGSTTHYAALVGDRSLFSPKGSTIKISNGSASPELYKGQGIFTVTDGTSNTIAIAPVDPARKIPWTKPEDILVGQDFPGLGQPGGIFTPIKIDGVGAAPLLIADGSVRTLSEKTDLATIRALTTSNLGEIIDSRKLIGPAGLRAPNPGQQQPSLHLYREGKTVSAKIE